MTKQTRHYAAGAQSKSVQAGPPAPGQALMGYPEPESSLFGVPLTSTSLFGVPTQSTGRNPGPSARSARTEAVSRRPAPPRPRVSRESVPPPRRRWSQRLALPLAIGTLGVTLGVIIVVMLLAAGVPAPWAAEPGPPLNPAPSAGPAEPRTETPVRQRITEDGTYLVGTQIRPGQYVTDGGVRCHWARLTGTEGAWGVTAEGNGPTRTVVRIRSTDTAFETSGCTTWTRRGPATS